MLDLVSAPPSNPVKDQRKQQLISATASCIYQYGLAGTTIQKVTKAASLSAGTVNFYFDSKEKLLIGTLESTRDEFAHTLLPCFESAASPSEKLEQAVALYFDEEICDPNKIAVWHAFSSASGDRAEYHRICGELEHKLYQPV